MPKDSTVSGRAWDAVRQEEERNRAEQKKRADAETRKANQEHKRLVKKHGHLLTDSILPTLFPDTEWRITRVSTTYSGANGTRNEPTVWVQDARDSPTFATEFRINEFGVYIDYDDERQIYGPPYWERAPSTVEIKSVLDVGRVLKRKSDIMSAQYRRNPD